MKKGRILFLSLVFAGFLAFGMSNILPSNAIVIEAATVKMNRKKITLQVGESAKLKLKGIKKKPKWKSSKKSVATVNKKGKVVAKKKGKAVITAKLDGKTYKCKIKVKNKRVEIEKIQINSKRLEIEFGETKQLSVSVVPTNANVKNVIWKSKDSNIAIVDQNGNVKGISTGVTTIYAESNTNSYVNDFCVVTVGADYNTVAALAWIGIDREFSYYHGDGIEKSVGVSKIVVDTSNIYHFDCFAFPISYARAFLTDISGGTMCYYSKLPYGLSLRVDTFSYMYDVPDYVIKKELDVNEVGKRKAELNKERLYSVSR